jgi:hypothetical protein
MITRHRYLLSGDGCSFYEREHQITDGTKRIDRRKYFDALFLYIDGVNAALMMMSTKRTSTIASAGNNDDVHNAKIVEDFGGLLIDQSHIARGPRSLRRRRRVPAMTTATSTIQETGAG